MKVVGARSSQLSQKYDLKKKGIKKQEMWGGGGGGGGQKAEIQHRK